MVGNPENVFSHQGQDICMKKKKIETSYVLFQINLANNKVDTKDSKTGVSIN